MTQENSSLVKDMVAFLFDSHIDRVMIMNHHGAVEVMGDEFYIDFELVNKSSLSSAKPYELVVMMYQPKLLRIIPGTRDVDINFW